MFDESDSLAPLKNEKIDAEIFSTAAAAEDASGSPSDRPNADGCESLMAGWKGERATRRRHMERGPAAGLRSGGQRRQGRGTSRGGGSRLLLNGGSGRCGERNVCSVRGVRQRRRGRGLGGLRLQLRGGGGYRPQDDRRPGLDHFGTGSERGDQRPQARGERGLGDGAEGRWRALLLGQHLGIQLRGRGRQAERERRQRLERGNEFAKQRARANERRRAVEALQSVLVRAEDLYPAASR